VEWESIVTNLKEFKVSKKELQNHPLKKPVTLSITKTLCVRINNMQHLQSILYDFAADTKASLSDLRRGGLEDILQYHVLLDGRVSQRCNGIPSLPRNP